MQAHTHPHACTHARRHASKLSLAHTRTYAFTITHITAGRLCTVVLGAQPNDAWLWLCNHKTHPLSLVWDSQQSMWSSSTSDAVRNDGPPDAQWNAQWSWSLLSVIMKLPVHLLFPPPLEGRRPLVAAKQVVPVSRAEWKDRCWSLHNYLNVL